MGCNPETMTRILSSLALVMLMTASFTSVANAGGCSESLHITDAPVIFPQGNFNTVTPKFIRGKRYLDLAPGQQLFASISQSGHSCPPAIITVTLNGSEVYTGNARPGYELTQAGVYTFSSVTTENEIHEIIVREPYTPPVVPVAARSENPELFEATRGFRVIPNPAGTNITIELEEDFSGEAAQEKVRCSLVKLDGTVVWQHTEVIERMQTRFPVQLTYPEPGMYLLYLSRKEWTFSQKILLQ